MVKIQKTSELAKLSIAALLVGTSIVAAQDAPAEATETAPAAEPVVIAPAPTVAAVAEPAPVAKPVESLSTTVAGTKISLYGRLELNSAYETDVTGGLWSSSAPKAAKGDAQSRISLGIARTRFGFNLSGPSKEDEPELTGKFEADFAGSSANQNFNGREGFRVRQSWGSVKFKDLGLTILFGQTDDVVNPIDPPSINPSSLNGAGNVGNRRPQIRITEAIGPVEIAVAATHDRMYGYTARKDAEVGDKDTASFTDNNTPALPAFQGRVGLKMPASWAGEKANLAVGIGGLYAKSEAASNDTTRYAKPEPSYMFGADLSLPIINILTLTGEFFTGQNLSRYEASLGQSRAYGKIKDKDGKFKDFGGIKSVGWWTGLSAKLPANLSAGAGIGGESLDEDSKSGVPGTCTKDDKGKRDCPGNMESNMFTFANVSYNFTSAAKITFEWLMFSSDYSKGKYNENDQLVVKDNGRPEFDGSYDRSLNRLELNFRYDFK
jgi:hypothetical protein